VVSSIISSAKEEDEGEEEEEGVCANAAVTVIVCKGKEDNNTPKDIVSSKRVNNGSTEDCWVMLHIHVTLPYRGYFLNFLPFLVVHILVLPFSGIYVEIK
jgi:hypothetical protein